MPRLQREDVNRRNTYTWEKMNNDGRAPTWRNKFISKYGRQFEGELCLRKQHKGYRAEKENEQ